VRDNKADFTELSKELSPLRAINSVADSLRRSAPSLLRPFLPLPPVPLVPRRPPSFLPLRSGSIPRRPPPVSSYLPARFTLSLASLPFRSPESALFIAGSEGRET